jgi:hypothetical protein
VSPVLAHVLILWGVVAVVLVSLRVAKRVGFTAGHLQYAGAFGFIGAAFGIVLGLTTFFASQHYANFREAAETEATKLGNAAAMSEAFPPVSGAAVRRQIYCYATDVIDKEWPTMASHARGAPSVEARQAAASVQLLRAGRANPQPASWYNNSLTALLDAGESRQQRLLLSQAQIPSTMWILIYVGAAVIVLFTYFFHLKSRRQLRAMMAAVVLMLTVIIGVLAGLDTPTDPPLALDPDAMIAEQRLLATTVSPPPTDPARYCAAVPAPVRPI